VECRRGLALASASVYVAEVVVLAKGSMLMQDKALRMQCSSQGA
jgi:hypothetical protein